MRISDWSSDVCSSDLTTRAGCSASPRDPERRGPGRLPGPGAGVARRARPGQGLARRLLERPRGQRLDDRGVRGGGAARPRGDACLARSEEHTSELQSLMRISYAVFCLKKKKKTHK